MVGVDYKLEGRQRSGKNKRAVSSMGSGRRGMRLNMTGWDPELITPSEQALAKPVLHIARFVYARVKRRTFTEAKSAQGRPWGGYSARQYKSKRKFKRKAGGHLWINPKLQQPKASGGYPVIIKSGGWRGWALYESSAQYAAALGKSQINWVNTGTLAQGMQVRPLTPLSTMITFYGGRRQVQDRTLGGSDDAASGGRRKSQIKNNRGLARALGKKGTRLIDVNRQDRIEVLRLMQTLLRPELLDLLKLVDDAVKARKALRSRDRVLAKIRRQFKLADDIKAGNVKTWPAAMIG